MRRLMSNSVAMGAAAAVFVALMLLVAPSMSPKALAMTAPQAAVPHSQMVGGFWFDSGDFESAINWAADFGCIGSGCAMGSEPAVVAACNAPAFVVGGSYLVEDADWMASSHLIETVLGPVSATQVTPEYQLLNLVSSADGVGLNGTVDLAGLYSLQAMGVGITPNSLYVFSPILRFQPHAAPQRVNGGTTAAFQPPTFPAATSPASVVTLDTGVVPTSNADLNHAVVAAQNGNRPSLAAKTKYFDIVDDAISGHGPAIADLIADMMGLPETPAARSHSALQPVTSNAPPGAITPKNPNGMFGHPDGTRAVDLASILEALDALDPASVDYVNFSIGTKSCPELTTKLAFNPITGKKSRIQIDPIREWLIENPDVTMVAAAGNSGSTTPTYPAAWTIDPEVPNIVSVGSMGRDGTRSCFSDHASVVGPSWVDFYAVGQDVVVEHPTLGRVVWSGTSFAAPQVAAALAKSQDPSTVAQPAYRVPAPSKENAVWCR